MKKILLWVDDLRNPVENNFEWPRKTCTLFYNELDVIWVKSYKEFCDYINENGIPYIISFDHDLGDYDNNGVEKTGFDCAKFLVEYCMAHNCDAPYFSVHSSNPVGKQNIQSLIDNWTEFFNANK